MDERIYDLLSPAVIGGLSVRTQRFAESRSKRLGDLDVEPHETCELLHFDFTSLYGYSLSTDVPYSNIKIWTADEVDSFNFFHYIKERDLI